MGTQIVGPHKGLVLSRLVYGLFFNKGDHMLNLKLQPIRPKPKPLSKVAFGHFFSWNDRIYIKTHCLDPSEIKCIGLPIGETCHFGVNAMVYPLDAEINLSYQCT